MTGTRIQPRLTELDALRGIAALAVVLFHYTHQFTIFFPAQPRAPVDMALGKHGVLLCFAISGFVIFMTLARTQSAGDFLVSRFARLFPAYWTAIALTTVIVWASGVGALSVGPGATAINLTMLQSYLRIPSVDGVYWTLSVELAFYGCMLALWRMDALRRIEWVLAVWLLLKWLWWLVPQLSWLVGILVVQRFVPFFAIGMLAYRIWSGKRTMMQQAPLLMAVLATIGVIDGGEYLAVAIAVSAIFTMLAARRWQVPVPAALNWLGGISYTLYLLHQHIGWVMLLSLERRGVTPQVAIGATTFCVLMLAWAVTAWIERPALVAIRRWWRARSKEGCAPATAR